MTTKYHARNYGIPTIEARTVEGETDKFVLLPASSPIGKARRVAKVSEHERWFDSWTQAQTWLLAQVNDKIERHQQELARLRDYASLIQNMTEQAVVGDAPQFVKSM